MSHVDKPFLVVKEAARVVKPGGMVGIFDGDYTLVNGSEEGVFFGASNYYSYVAKRRG